MEQEVKVIKSDNKVYAIYDHIGNLKNEAVWYGEEKDFLQASKMAYDMDKLFRVHRHKIRPREIPKTQEAIVVISGCLEATVYDNDKKMLGSFLLYDGSMGLFLDGFHGFKVMCDDTTFYEIKHGTFVGVEADKEFLK